MEETWISPIIPHRPPQILQRLFQLISLISTDIFVRRGKEDEATPQPNGK